MLFRVTRASVPALVGALPTAKDGYAAAAPATTRATDGVVAHRGQQQDEDGHAVLGAREKGVLALALIGSAVAASPALAERPDEDAQRKTLGSPGPNWQQALQARSAAMNRYYGLGEYARHGARSQSVPGWLATLNARSDALNRQYGLGDYADA